jgi:uncharacterized membrane protein YgcG
MQSYRQIIVVTKRVKLRAIIMTLLVIGTCFIVTGGSITPAIAQSAKTFIWRRLDCDITIQPNGDLRISEKNEINFISGSFTFGYRDIEMSRITSISDIRATEGDRDIRIETGRAENGDFRIKYYFSRPAQNETRTFNLTYTVQGATRYYQNGDQVYWACVYAARSGFEVQNSRTTIRLPGNATATVAETYGAKATLSGKGETIVTATATEPIASGKELEVRVQFPHGIISGTAPAWQQAYDKQREFEETQKPRLDLIGLVVGALAALFGPAGVFVMWQTRGKDPRVGLIADYITAPPSNLSPGIAGALIDEQADLQDVLATLIDLARKGVIDMREDASSSDKWQGVSDWIFSTGEKPNQSLLPHEQKLLNALNLNQGERRLSELKNKFFVQLGGIKESLYDQLVAQKFYFAKPPSTRNNYILLGVLILVSSVAACLGSGVLLNGSDYFICLPIALFFTGVLTIIIARAMPQATRLGAEAKMRARAFKRYLENIERYTDLNTAKAQFDTYLPYAIAFGLERSWIKKFAQVDTPMPPWYQPYDPYYDTYGRRGRVYGSGGGKVLERGEMTPDISGRAEKSGGMGNLDRSLTGGLNSLSDNLTKMLTVTAGTLTSVPAPKVSSGSSGGTGWGSSSGRSGGWSGGGSIGGGSSGRGGGGFG